MDEIIKFRYCNGQISIKSDNNTITKKNGEKRKFRSNLNITTSSNESDVFILEAVKEKLTDMLSIVDAKIKEEIKKNS